MHASMWTYAWDIGDVGLDQALADIGGRAGLNAVSLATSYHAGRFLQPRSPKRKSYFPEDGTIYFQPTPARWERSALKPKVAGILAETGDVLGQLVEKRRQGGMAACCWTVCLHNTRLGMLHPEAVTRNAFGDPNYYSLCPSNDAARTYAATLVEDVSRSYRPDIIELESPCFMGFAHGYHHEKDGVGLEPEDEFLLSLCFCPSCIARAARSGADGKAARSLVRRWLAEMAERPVPKPRWPDFPARGIETFRGFPDLYDYLNWRFEPVTSLVAEMRERADPASRIVVIDGAEGWRDGCAWEALGRACDGLLLCAYDMEPGKIGEFVAAGRAALGPDKFLGTGFRVFYPEVTGGHALAAKAVAAKSAGADGINFYNYGLIPEARLDWVGQASEAVNG